MEAYEAQGLCHKPNAARLHQQSPLTLNPKP